jgi:hypothetical protein
VSKAGTNSEFVLYGKEKVLTAETQETIEDITAEAEAEVANRMKEKRLYLLNE